LQVEEGGTTVGALSLIPGAVAIFIVVVVGAVDDDVTCESFALGGCGAGLMVVTTLAGSRGTPAPTPFTRLVIL